MPWVKIDDRCTEHPKIASLGPLGFAAWVAGLCYCNRNLTDGFIPEAVARTLFDWAQADAGGVRWDVGLTRSAELVSPGVDVDGELVIGWLLDAGAWEAVAGGYQIHDYLDYQPSRADVEAISEVRSEAGRKGGLAKAKQRASNLPSKHPGKAEAKVCPVPEPVNYLSSPNGLSSSSAVDQVWLAYLEHHPKAALTKARRDLIERRLRDHDADTLIAAIQGNHRSPFHCGENEGGKLYHDLGLILRDADKVEAFAALAAEQPTARLARKGKLSPRELAALADELDGGDPFGFIQIEAAS